MRTWGCFLAEKKRRKNVCYIPTLTPAFRNSVNFSTEFTFGPSEEIRRKKTSQAVVDHTDGGDNGCLYAHRFLEHEGVSSVVKLEFHSSWERMPLIGYIINRRTGSLKREDEAAIGILCNGAESEQKLRKHPSIQSKISRHVHTRSYDLSYHLATLFFLNILLMNSNVGNFGSL